jgi:hypothetical protein
MPQILRHGTHGFTYLPKEGMLRIFPPLKIRWLRPRTWVPEASTLTPRPPKPLILVPLTVVIQCDNWAEDHQIISIISIAHKILDCVKIFKFTLKFSVFGFTRLEIFPLVGCYSELLYSRKPTFRDGLSVPSSRMKHSPSPRAKQSSRMTIEDGTRC